MISKTIKSFSEFVGKPWKNPLKDPIAFDEISASYKRAKKTIDNLREKTHDYIVQTLKEYGEINDQKITIESPRYTYMYDMYDKVVLIIDNDGVDDVINFDDLSPDKQFDFLERLNLHIAEADLKGRAVWEEK